MLSNGNDFDSKRHLASLGDIFSCHNWGYIASAGAEARETAKHPTMQRTAQQLPRSCTTEELSGQMSVGANLMNKDSICT